jgi:carbamoyl-phosphate synthase large subunit
VVPKVGQGTPNVVDRIEKGDVHLVFNTVESVPSAVRDSFSIRRAALNRGVPYFTTLAGLRAAAGAIRALRKGSIGVKPLQEVHGRR